MPLLSLDRINQWVPLDFMLKTDKMKLPLHEFSFVKATYITCYASGMSDMVCRQPFAVSAGIAV